MTMLVRLLANPTAERIARAHLHFLWQGLVVGVAALLVLAAMRRASPSARYLAVVILLSVMAVCPFATYLLMPAGPDGRSGSSGSEFAAIRTASEPRIVTPNGPAQRESTTASTAPHASSFSGPPAPRARCPA